MEKKINAGILFLFYTGIRDGMTVKKLCAKTKVSRSSYYRWVKIGKKASKRYRSGEKVDDFEMQCMKFYNVVRAAEERREL